MSSYRPIADTWILARAKLTEGKKYYGAYPGGFLTRARRLLGVRLEEPLLHICGGMARYYPYRGGFGPHDCTLDLDPATEPTFLRDARDPFPELPAGGAWPGVLIDPPYTEGDAEKYVPGAKAFPAANLLLKHGIEAVRVGGRVGVLHYLWPKPPANAESVAVISVYVGFNNRVRCFSVFERVA